MNTERPPTLDPTAVARWQRMAPPVSPWLHEEVASRMLDRLQWIKLQPKAWAHWGAVRGGLQNHQKLAQKYSNSECFVVESQSIPRQTAINKIAIPWWQPARWLGKTARFEAPAPGSVDMLWANMALHEAADPQALLASWHHALTVGGFLMFSCLGPDTAIELREVYRQLAWPPAGHELTDMHDWGDMLVAGGFAEPVMDMERITLTYATPADLLKDLRLLGRNLHHQRHQNLRGRGWKKSLENALLALAEPDQLGRLVLTVEVIYGHALKPLPKVRLADQSSVTLAQMKTMLGRSSGNTRLE